MSTALSPKIIKVRRDNKQQIELRHLIKKYRKFDKNRTIVNNYLPELLISVWCWTIHIQRVHSRDWNRSPGPAGRARPLFYLNLICLISIMNKWNYWSILLKKKFSNSTMKYDWQRKCAEKMSSVIVITDDSFSMLILFLV